MVDLTPEECIRHPDEFGIRHRQVFDLLCREEDRKKRLFSARKRDFLHFSS
jgi:hypothetical protein